MPNEETKNDQESGMDHAFVHDLERNMLAGRRAGKLWRALNIALSVGGRQTVVSPDEASQQMYADRLTKMATKRGLEPMLHYDDDGMYVEWGESKISIRTFEQLRKSAGETVSICSTGPFGKRLPE